MAPGERAEHGRTGGGVSAIHVAVEQYLTGLTIRQGALTRAADSACSRGSASFWPVRSRLGVVRERAYYGDAAAAKSTFVAALACAALVPVRSRSRRSEVSCGRRFSIPQARIIYRHVKRFLAPEIEARKFRKWDTIVTAARYSRALPVRIARIARREPAHDTRARAVACDL